MLKAYALSTRNVHTHPHTKTTSQLHSKLRSKMFKIKSYIQNSEGIFPIEITLCKHGILVHRLNHKNQFNP